MSNSSGSVERFLIGLNESKEWESLAPGGNTFSLEIDNPINQGMDGLMASGNNANVVIALQTGEVPVSTAATLTTALAGANNDLVFTARTAGSDGNNITIAYSDPGGATATASIAVVGTAITISLGRAASAIDTTATAVKALIDGFAPAAALVSVANSGADTGAGLVIALAVTPLTGGISVTGPVTYTTVGSTVTVVPGGHQVLTGAVGRFARIRNTGSGLASIVARPLHRVQPKSLL